MLKAMTLSMTLALAACSFLAATPVAAETQRWSVQFSDDVAVLRVSTNTERKFLTATIALLQNAGAEKITFSVLEPKASMDITKTAFSIQINEGVAEINASADLPHKVLVSLISQLKDADITKIKFAVAKDSVGAPASQQ